MFPDGYGYGNARGDVETVHPTSRQVLVLDNLSRSSSSSIDRVLALAAREHHLAASDVHRRLAFTQAGYGDVRTLAKYAIVNLFFETFRWTFAM